MKRKELEQEIQQTNLTLKHLIAIGETATAANVARYLDELFIQRNKAPDLRLVKR